MRSTVAAMSATSSRPLVGPVLASRSPAEIRPAVSETRRSRRLISPAPQTARGTAAASESSEAAAMLTSSRCSP